MSMTSKRFVGEKIGLSTIVRIEGKLSVLLCEECGGFRNYETKRLSSFIKLCKSNKNFLFRCQTCASTITSNKRWKRDLPKVRLWEKSLIGNKYGKLTVLDAFREKENNGTNSLRFRVKCECNKEYFSRAEEIMKGRRSQCFNCGKKATIKYLPGYKIGMLEITFNFGKDKVETKCTKCGLIKKIDIQTFRKGACNLCKPNSIFFDFEGNKYNLTTFGALFGKTKERARQVVKQYGVEGAAKYFRNRLELVDDPNG